MRTRYATRSVLCAVSVVISLGITGQAQTPQLPPTVPRQGGISSPDSLNRDDDAPPFKERQKQLQIEDRHRHIRKDVNRIVQLTQKLQDSLKDHADLTDEDRRTLQEIEKLSHDAQNRMKQ